MANDSFDEARVSMQATGNTALRNLRLPLPVARPAAIPPSAELIRYVVGHEDPNLFVESGRNVFTMFQLALLRNFGQTVQDFERVLDFGCGIGRLLQYVSEGVDIAACDISDPAIEYLRGAFPGVNSTKGPLYPPSAYRSGQFDLVYSFSVFSHLRLDAERIWLRELYRLGKPGCVYLLTVHGDWFIDATLGDRVAEAREAGFLYRDVHSRSGSNLDFPDYYEASYHTSNYIRQVWSALFDVVEIIKGDDPARHLWGELTFGPDSVPPLMPMGQDLVVLRKPLV